MGNMNFHFINYTFYLFISCLTPTLYSYFKKLYYRIFHSVTSSPWPVLLRILSFTTFIITLQFFLTGQYNKFVIRLFFLSILIIFWFKDVKKERKNGEHSPNIKDGLKVRIIIFVLSEVLFFGAWFWGFFHNSLSPINESGNTWPPRGINSIDPYSVPVLNTILLVRRGIFVTWAHNSFNKNERINLQILITIIFGALFTINQGIEYIDANFSISDRIFG